MKHTNALILTFSLVVQSCHGLVVLAKHGSANATAVVQTPAENARLTQRPSKVGRSHPTLLLRYNMHNTKVDPVIVRPTVGGGPEVVDFAIRIMNFYGTNLKAHTIALAMAMSLRWKDPRVVDLLPEGLDQMSMAWDQALKRLWMPGIVVTNRDIRKYEIISASVTIFRTGEVLRVERAQARVMKKFELEAYPFDSQHLEVKLASSKYMVNEVVLVADNKSFGVEENVFGGVYDVEGWHTNVYTSYDGDLKKSRGLIDIQVQRQLGKYVDDHLVPTSIALSISWAVFYFPFAGPFITPRLALSILALLTFTNLMVKSSKELPGAAPFNWNDLLNQQIQALMFITIVFNIFTEIMMHSFQREGLARMMNNDAKIFVPVVSMLNITLILGSARWHWMGLWTCTLVTKIMLLLLTVGYGGRVYCAWHHEVYKAGDKVVFTGAAAVIAAAAAGADGADDAGGGDDCDM